MNLIQKHLKFHLLFLLLFLCSTIVARLPENKAQEILNDIENLSASDSKLGSNAKKALLLAQKNRWPRQEARAYYVLSQHMLASGDTASSLKLSHQSWSVYQKLPPDKSLQNAKMDVIEMICRYYFLEGKTDSLFGFLNEIESHQSTLVDTMLLASIVNLKGVYHFQVGNHYSAISNYEAAISFYRLLGTKRQLASNLYNLGILQRRNDNHQESLSLLLEAVEYFVGDSLLLEKAYCLNAIGAVLMKLKEPERAIKYQQRGYEIFKKTNDSLNVAITLNAMGLCHHDMGQLKLAVSDLNKALEIKKRLGNARHISVTLHNIGFVYLKLDTDSALNYLRQAENIKRKLNDRYGLSSVYLDISQAYVKKSDIENSLLYLNRSEELASETGALSLLLQNYKLRKELAQKTGNTEMALHYLEKHDSLNQEIYQLEARKEIEQLEAHYRNRENEQQILLQEGQINLKNEQLKQERSFKVFMGIGLVLSISIIVILVAFFRQRQRTQKLILQQKTLEAELTGEEQERQRIAESLHDDAAGNLSAASNILKQLSKKHSDIPLLEKVYESTYSAYQTTRLTSHQLAPYEHFGRNLIQGLKEFFSGLEESESLKVLFTHPEESELQKLDEPLQLLIYRSLQELTINTVKHAGASLLKVMFKIDNTRVTLEVKDNGKGLEESTSKGLGLSNLKRKIKAQNGRFDIESLGNGGTLIRIEIPLKWQSQ